MEKFIGVKEITARPMTRQKYNDYRGWELPSDENGADEGYLKDDGDGHIQWDPKEVFEKSHVELSDLEEQTVHIDMPAYQLRVHEEVQELIKKTSDLAVFMLTDFFKELSKDERLRMSNQLLFMKGYMQILFERIKNFK